MMIAAYALYVTVSLAIAGAQATGGSGSDTLLNIEKLTGSAFADTLAGNSAANTLTGSGGADTFVLNGILASDTISDFLSGTDKLRISQARIAVGNGDTTVDGATTVAATMTPAWNPPPAPSSPWTCT